MRRDILARKGSKIKRKKEKNLNIFSFYISKSKCKLEPSLPYARNTEIIENIEFEVIRTSLTNFKLAVLYGPPGIGKTSNALEYAYKMQELKSNWNPQWFNANSKGEFFNNLRGIHNLLNQKTIEEKEIDFDYLVKFMKKQFNLYKETSFLVVLDNLIDVEWIESFLVNMPENVHVLITSRNKNVLSKIKLLDIKAQKLEIKYFTKENAKFFFDRNINRELREFNGEEIALLEGYFSELDVLPYDLNLLVSVLNENQLLDVTSFFERDKKLCEKIFDSLYKVIEKQSEKAWQALEYISLIDCLNIPTFLLMKLVDIQGKLEFHEMILDILQKNGLIEVYKIRSEIYLRVHNRTQSLVKIIIDNKSLNTAEIESKLIEILCEEMPKANEYPDDSWTKTMFLLPHSLKFIQQIKNVLPLKQLVLIDKVAQCYEVAMSDYKKSLDLLYKSLEIKENYFEDKNHSSIVETYDNIGRVSYDLGLFEKALEYHQKSLKIQEKFYSDQKSCIANSHKGIGKAFHRLGLHEKSLDSLFKSVDLIEDKNSSFLATVFNCIGSVYFFLGIHEKSQDFYFKSLEIEEKLHPEKDHPSLCTMFNNIGLNYYYMSSYDKSLEYYLKILSISEHIYKNHKSANLANTYINIGDVYSKLDFHEKALEYCHKSIEIFESIYQDKKHLFVAYAYNVLASCHLQKGDFSIALEHQLLSIQIMKSCFVNENQFYFGVIYFNAAEIYLKLNNLEQALENYFNSLKIREKIFENHKRHPLLHRTYKAISNTFSLMQNMALSSEYNEKAQKVLDPTF